MAHTISIAKQYNYFIVPFSFSVSFHTDRIAKFRSVPVVLTISSCERNYNTFEFISRLSISYKNHCFTNILIRKKNFTCNIYSLFSFSFYFGYIDQIVRNLTKRKEFLGPFILDNIDIRQDWVIDEENLLDKDDFNMD